MLRDRPDLTPEQLQRTRDLMNAHVPECLVVGYEHRIEEVSLPDPDDRHVLAAAIHGEADMVLTINLRDFPEGALQPWGIIPVHPDTFLTDQLDQAPEIVCEAVRTIRARLRKPRRTVVEYLAILERQGLPRAARRLGELAARL